MTFRAQLVVGHALPLVVTLVTGAIATIALRVASTRLEYVSRVVASDTIAIEQLRFEAEQLVASSRGYLLAADPSSLTHFERGVERLDASLHALDPRTDLAVELANVRGSAHVYIAAAEVATRVRSATHDPSEIIPMFERTLGPAREMFVHALDAFATREQSAFDRASAHARTLAERSQTVVFATMALALVLGIALTLLSIRKLDAHHARERAISAEARTATAMRDELLAIVSHDLRSPLTAIVLGAQLVEAAPDPTVRRQGKRISGAAARMKHLIDQLLDVAAVEHGKLELACERCFTGDLVRAVAALFDVRAAETGIVLRADADDTSVHADRERLLRVLTNLVANAFKFTPAGGTIEVAVRRDGERVRFEVTDSGAGIPEEQLPKLFDRFWRGPRDARGLGLGLYICKQLVAAHGGDLCVRSTVGAGSTFWFALPEPHD